MPSAPKKLCAYQGCNRKVKKGYCEEHKSFDNSFATKKSDHWYNLPIWKGNPNKPLGERGGMREAQLLREPYCRTCKEEKGIIKDITGKGAGVADHIIPFRSVPKEQQWEYFTNPDNHQFALLGFKFFHHIPCGFDVVLFA